MEDGPNLAESHGSRLDPGVAAGPTGGSRTSTYRTLEMLVYEDIRAAIVDGRFRPGQALVASTLARELGVSRAPVTVALKRLQSEGFIDGDPHKVFTVTSLSVQRVREIYAMRGVLEALAAEEAARHGTTEQIQDLRALAEAMERVEAFPAEWRRLDTMFHRRLREASGMPLLTATLANLFDRCEFYRVLLDQQVWTDQDRLKSRTEHAEMVAALESGDDETAARVMARHLKASLARLIQCLNGAAPTAPDESKAADVPVDGFLRERNG